jgi:hypothetical protein
VYSCTADFYNAGEEKVHYALEQYNHFFAGKEKLEVQDMLHDYYIHGAL